MLGHVCTMLDAHRELLLSSVFICFVHNREGAECTKPHQAITPAQCTCHDRRKILYIYLCEQWSRTHNNHKWPMHSVRPWSTRRTRIICNANVSLVKMWWAQVCGKPLKSEQCSWRKTNDPIRGRCARKREETKELLVMHPCGYKHNLEFLL